MVQWQNDCFPSSRREFDSRWSHKVEQIIWGQGLDAGYLFVQELDDWLQTAVSTEGRGDSP